MLPSYPDPVQLLVLYGVAGLAVGILERRRLAAMIRYVGRPASYFVTASVVILMLCQAYMPGRTFYPWAAWSMYSDPAPSPQLWVFETERESGARDILSSRRLVRGPNVRPVMRHLYSRASAWDRAREAGPPARRVDGPDPTPDADAELQVLLSALVALDERHSPDDPIVRIELQECRIEGPPPWDRSSLECAPVGLEWVPTPRPSDAP